MSGFKLVIGFVAIIIIGLLWIGLNEVMVNVGSVFNSMTTDADTITRNNMGLSIFYYSLFFMIIVIAIWVVKSSLDERDRGYRVVYE